MGQKDIRRMGREELYDFYKLLDIESVKEVLPQIEKGIHDELNATFTKEKASKIIQNNKMLLKLNAFMNGEYNIPFDARKKIIPKVYFSNMFSEGCLKGLKDVTETVFYIKAEGEGEGEGEEEEQKQIKSLMVTFSFMVMKLEDEDDEYNVCSTCNSCKGCNCNNNNKNKKWFMCDITFFCKVEDKLAGKTYYNTKSDISQQLIEFKHKQSELMKHKSGVERKKMLTESEKRRIEEYEKEIKSKEQEDIEKIDAALFHTPMIYLSHNFYTRNDISIFSQMFKILM